MADEDYMRLPRSFWVCSALLLMWIWLLPGIRLIVKGVYDWTTFLLLGLGIIVCVGAFGSKLISKMEKIKYNKSRMLITIAGFVVICIYELFTLLRPRHSFADDTTFWRIHSVGALIFMGYIIWKAVITFRATHSIEE